MLVRQRQIVQFLYVGIQRVAVVPYAVRGNVSVGEIVARQFTVVEVLLHCSANRNGHAQNETEEERNANKYQQVEMQR